MTFSEWLKLQELTTSTSCVAMVPLRWGTDDLITRTFPDKVVFNDEDKHKKKRKKSRLA